MAETYNAATNTRTATFQRPKKIDYNAALRAAVDRNRATLAQRYEAKGNTAAAAKLRASIGQGQTGRTHYGKNARVTPTTAATGGGTGEGGGGTPTTDITAAYEEAAMKLAQALRGQGLDWTRTAGQAYAPPASLVGGTAWRRIQNMPSLYNLMLLARAAAPSGQPAPDYLAEIQQFQHAAPSYSQVSYGW